MTGFPEAMATMVGAAAAAGWRRRLWLDKAVNSATVNC